MKRFPSFLLVIRLLFASIFAATISILFFLEPIKQGATSLRNSFFSSQEDSGHPSVLTGEGLNSKGSDPLRIAFKEKRDQLERVTSEDSTAEEGRPELTQKTSAQEHSVTARIEAMKQLRNADLILGSPKEYSTTERIEAMKQKRNAEDIIEEARLHYVESLQSKRRSEEEASN